MFKIVEFSHFLIQQYFEKYKKEKMVFIDATCGRGKDTIFMANILKEHGKVYSYDIQPEAISFTAQELTKNKINNVELRLESHTQIIKEKMDLVLFNLGYLPSGNKEITTKVETTLPIVQHLVSSFSENPNLLIIIAIYPGHPEGLKESIALDSYTKDLPGQDYLVCKYLNYNRPNSPYILTISSNRKTY